MGRGRTERLFFLFFAGISGANRGRIGLWGRKGRGKVFPGSRAERWALGKVLVAFT